MHTMLRTGYLLCSAQLRLDLHWALLGMQGGSSSPTGAQLPGLPPPGQLASQQLQTNGNKAAPYKSIPVTGGRAASSASNQIVQPVEVDSLHGSGTTSSSDSDDVGRALLSWSDREELYASGVQKRGLQASVRCLLVSFFILW